MSPRHVFRGGTISGMAGGNPHMEAFGRYALDMFDQIGATLGYDFDNPSADVTLPAPDACGFVVQGADGNFTVKITLPQNFQPQNPTMYLQFTQNAPNVTGRKIQHRLQKSTDITFSTPSLITELPLTFDTVIVDKEPNVAKYWRLQSRFDGGGWNDWQLYSSPILCGPVAVYSGLLKTESNDLLNSAATTTDGTNALSQDGVTTNILVAAKTWNVGPQQIAYGSGQVDPGSFGTWHIYAVDLRKAGGNVTYIATANTGIVTSDNGIIYFGHIATAGGGGATGSGGGEGGGCTVTGTPITRMDGSKTPVEKLRKGDAVRAEDGGEEVLQEDAKPHIVHCFEITAENGLVLKCAGTHDLELSSGMFRKAEFMHTGDPVSTEQGQGSIVGKKWIGKRVVWELKLSRTKRYCAAGFWSHNKIAGNL